DGTPVSNFYTTTHAVGSYNYYCAISETTNYESASENGLLTITELAEEKNTTILTLTATPSWTNIYPTETTVSCTANHDEATPALYLDGVPVSNSYTTTHDIGSYNYYCAISETTNYESASENGLLSITSTGKSTATLTLTATPSWTNTYPTETTVNCTANHDEASPVLYVNGASVSNNFYTTTHAGGSYYYYCT
ncbi:unnamed protein product, partial [marine sediment metagenome]